MANLFSTLTEAVLAQEDNEQGIVVIDGHDSERFLSYPSVTKTSLHILHALQAKGLQVGDELVFQLADISTFIHYYWACILGGIIPVPLSAGRNPDQVQKLLSVWDTLDNPHLIIPREGVSSLQRAIQKENDQFVDRIAGRTLITQETIGNEPGNIYAARPDDIAYIQFSSGSTNAPKGVVLTHKNLVTNCYAMLNSIDATEAGDTFYSWMPLTHDMGLIGYHLSPLIAGWTHYIMPTELFIRRPKLWLEKISEHQLTITASPNFGYKYVLDHVDEQFLNSLDLSSLRIIINGAEPISAPLCRDFLDRMAHTGLKPSVMLPVYGLAEASLAVTFSKPSDELKSLAVDRGSLISGQKIDLQNQDDTIEVVNLGRILPNNCAVQIRHEGTVCADEVIGNVFIKGDNVTSGYFNNPEQTAKTIDREGWLDTGDLGFLQDDCLFVTGRQKDIIFVNGQNYYPHDLEMSVGEIVPQGKVVFAGSRNYAQSEDDIIGFVIHKGKAEKFLPTATAVKSAINQVFGFYPKHLIPVTKIPKTTSGKVQRFRLVKNYEEGAYTEVIEEMAVLARAQSSSESSEATNDLEAKLADIASTLLAGANVDVQRSLFEQGFNSLIAGQFLARTKQAFGVELRFLDLWENATIAALGRLIDEAEQSEFVAIPYDVDRIRTGLSPLQLGMYYFWATQPESTAYNIPVAYTLDGELDIPRFQEAFNAVVEANSILRTNFVFDQDQPFQVVHPHADVQIEEKTVDFSKLNEQLSSQIQPFNLETGNLFRVVVFTSAQGEQVLFLDFHHIIFDGYSCYQLLQDVFALYHGHAYEPGQVQYGDFVDWQADQTESLAKGKAFWGEYLASSADPLDFQTDFARPSERTYQGSTFMREFSAELTTKLTAFAQAQKTTEYAVLLASYSLFLTRYTRQDSVRVGIPANVRTHPDVQRVLGMFVNNLCYQFEGADTDTFEQVVQSCSQDLMMLIEHQQYPYANMVEDLGLKSDMSRDKLFDTMLVYQNFSEDHHQFEDLKLSRHRFDMGFSKYDFSLEFLKSADTLQVQVEYATSLFERASAEQIFGAYTEFLSRLLASAQVPVSQVGLTEQIAPTPIKEEEGEFVPVNIQFLQLAQLQPDAVAIVEGEHTLSYQQLAQQSLLMADEIQQGSTDDSVPVAILLDRSAQFIAAAISVLNAGKYYLPIDLSLPKERVHYILKDSGAKLLISSAEALDTYDLNGFERTLIVEDFLNHKVSDNARPTGEIGSDLADLAYVIYTSGTTGNPKGVEISHKSLANYIRWCQQQYHHQEAPVYAFYSSVSFDLTVTSIFSPLVAGGSIKVFQEREGEFVINEVLQDPDITVLKLTPSHLKMFNAGLAEGEDADSSLKTLIVGGEELLSSTAKQTMDRLGHDTLLINEYGPTEATVGCMNYRYDVQAGTSGPVSIGTAIGGMRVYVLDQALNPVPAGGVGELFISGIGVAQGYLGNPSLTEQKFLDDPFNAGEKMYRSGDLVNVAYDGQLYFKGRIDNQVKVNGYRIELDEVTEALVKLDAVEEAFVMIRDLGGTASLVGYVKEAGTDIPVAELPSQLAVWLPDYMIPRVIIPVEEIPLTVNGKVDVSKLPAKYDLPETERKLPVSEQEKIIVEVWAEVLGNPHISLTESFFELGGDSIKAVQVSSRLLNEEVSLSAKDILKHQTIEKIIEVGAVQVSVNEYEQGLIEGEKGATPIENWFFGKEWNNASHYNQSVLLNFRESIDKPALTSAFKILTDQHDALRLQYSEANGTAAFGKEYAEEDILISELTLGEDTKAHQEQKIRDFCAGLKASLSLEEQRLMHLGVIRMPNERDILFITIHHLLVDGLSWRILLEDFRTAYQSIRQQRSVRLPKKTASLKDWSIFLQEQLVEEVTQKELNYWQNAVAKYKPGLYRVGGVFKAMTEELVIDQELSEFYLDTVPNLLQVEPQVLLLGIIHESMCQIEESNDVFFELEHHGRNIEGLDISRTMGWFTVMYPFIFSVDKKQPRSQQLQQLQEDFAEVPSNGLGYAIARHLTKSLVHDPMCMVRFNYLGEFGKELSNELFFLNNQDTGSESDPQNRATAKIEFNLLVINQQLRIQVNFSDSVYSQDQMTDLRLIIKTELEHTKAMIEAENMDSNTQSDQFLDVELDEEDLDILFQ